MIDPRFEGQGLASQLVRQALSETRSDEVSVLPFSPFVRGAHTAIDFDGTLAD